MGWTCLPREASGRGGDQGEAAQARRALLRGAHGGERRLLVSAVRAEAHGFLTAAVHERDEDPLGQLALVELHVEIALGDLERLLRRSEESFVLPLSEPERTADAARDVDRVRLALVEPGRGHRAAQLLHRLFPRPELVDESE